MNEEQIKADGDRIAGYTIAKLDALPGDVVVVTPEAGVLDAEEARQLGLILDEWRKTRGYLWRFLVMPAVGGDLAVIHTLDEAELERAGPGGFPGEHRCAHGVFDPERVCTGSGLDPHIPPEQGERP